MRLPVAFLEPFEAEAQRTGKPLVDVMASRLDVPARAPRSASDTVARGRSPKVTHAKPAAAVPVAARAPRQHLPQCKCAMCRPIPKGGKR